MDSADAGNEPLAIGDDYACLESLNCFCIPMRKRFFPAAYPITPGTICPADWNTYQAIRQRFKIPHDGLRHTAISAFVSLHGSFAEAASQFGNSESMIRTHYFNRMTKSEAQDFFAVVPVATWALAAHD